MSREKLILVPSERMDRNKKENRNEHGLIRMSKTVRKFMGFDEKVEVYPETDDTTKRINGAMLLTIFQAYSDDINKLKEVGYSEEELKRVGFVTYNTFRKITNSKAKSSKNIWVTNDIADTVIGADPEFLLFDSSGQIVHANNVLSYNGLIGCDGAMAEIRPHPAIKPEGLVENIRTLFKDDKLVEKIKGFDWIAGCYHKNDKRDYPIGGHLHIGNPIQIARLDMNQRTNFFKAFNKIIDELLSIPMVKIDGSVMGKARRTECTMGHFGYFGEFRTCNGRLEHRTLSGMWLMHPILSTMVFGTAKAIIDEVFRHVADKKYAIEYMFPSKLQNVDVWSPGFNRWQQIELCKDLDCVKPSSEMIELLHKSAASKVTAQFLKAWHDRMKILSTYKLYSKYIDGLYEILKSNTKVFQEFNKRIQTNWLEDGPFIN
jgi:hypothetical protein